MSMAKYCKNESCCCECAKYKEVVVIGNGPSGILLSYVLSGNWPYYNGEAHQDDMLMARLNSIDPQKSLMEQDLEFLSQGMEGRSRNPVAVLVDKLNHPLDVDNNHRGLLRWEYHPDKAVDHVVIGKGRPGGCWQVLNDNITTISVSSWMELPEFSFNKWEAGSFSKKCSCANNRPPMRVKVKRVALYYRDYVHKMGLMKNFRNYSFVTSVKKVEINAGCKSIGGEHKIDKKLWEVEGFDSVRKEHFKYVCKNVVLATGTSDARNVINVSGELNYLEWVFHDVNKFEKAVIDLKKNQLAGAFLDPVMIVGSGLSAADAILIADRFGLSVLHVFTTCEYLNERKFSKNMYPEYNHIYCRMKNEEQSNDYKALRQYEILEICQSYKGRRVRVKIPNGTECWYKVTLLAVMTGYLPDLSYLKSDLESGKVLGVKKNDPIDSQKNPIAISPWTYEVTNAPKGMYAMGPLVGDNVVRVIPGGAIAIAGHIHKQNIK